VHSWDFPIEKISQLVPVTAAAGTFSICAAIWSKTSFALTLLRLTEGWMRWVLWFVIISMNVAMGFSAIIFFIQCQPIRKSWDPFSEGTCWPSYVLVNYDIFAAGKGDSAWRATGE
jgi:hypothetical protein